MEERIIEEYRVSMKALSKFTRKAYLTAARNLIRFAEKKGIPSESISEKVLEEYAVGNADKRKLARKFYHYLLVKNYISSTTGFQSETYLQSVRGIEFLEKYLVSLQTRKYLSKRSLSITRSYIGRFLKYLKDNEVKDIERVTKKIISDYSLYLLLYRFKRAGEESAYRASTRSQILIQVRNFFEFLRKEGVVLINPAQEVSLPKLPKAIFREVPTTEEVDRILNAVDKSKMAGLRNYAMIETMYSTGLRSPELIRLKVEDIDFERKFIIVRKGKYGKPRTVPVSGPALYALSEYLEKSRPLLIAKRAKDEGYLEASLFLDIKYGNNLSTQTVEEVVKTTAAKAGVKKRLIPHSYRYACATHMMQNGADIRYIQELLGHESVGTTQGYTRVVKGDLKRMIQKFHPRECNSKEAQFEEP